MRLVVTGAKGFLGSVMCVRAAELGHYVLALDDESRGLNDVSNLPNVRYRQHDCRLGLASALPLLESGVPPDAVIHFAAGTGSLDRPLPELLELNRDMAATCFRDAAAVRTKVFAFPTTSLAIAVPDSPYVQSKEQGMTELRALGYHLGHSNMLLPLRFFNVIGAYAGMTEHRRKEVHIIPTMIQASRQGLPFTINGVNYDTPDGTPGRDFIHVLDVVETILQLIEDKIAGATPDTGPDGCCWLGTGKVTTAKEMTELFQRHVAPLLVHAGPRRAFDCGSLRCDHPTYRVKTRKLRPVWAGLLDEARALEGKDLG